MSNATPETSVIFFPGGHDHDGNGSNLIETTAYSIYDWNVGYTGTGSRLVRQQDNFESLKVVVTQMVTDAILTPSGVRLSPNNVRAVHIQANSIGAEKLEANLVLVNNVIKSNNFNGTINANNQITSQGSAGWAITSSGDAVFSNTAIRGGLTAEAVYVGANNYWYSNGAFSLGGSVGITKTASGDVTIGSDVVINGNISATNLTDGTLTSTPGGNDIDLNFGSGKFTVDSDGNVFANNAEFTGNVTFGGELVGPTGTIGGWTINADNLFASGTEAAITLNADSGGIEAEQGSNFISIYPTTLLMGYGNDIYVELMSTGGESSYFTYINTDGITVNDYPFEPTDQSAAKSIPARRAGDASITANYFVMDPGGSTVSTASSTNVRMRDSDGYILQESSSRKLKKDIENIINVFDVVKQLQPVSFNWKDESMYTAKNSAVYEKLKLYKEYGFIAEDVESVIPELAIYTSNEDGSGAVPKMWQQNGMIAVSIAAIKELITKVETMEQRIQELENGV